MSTTSVTLAARRSLVLRLADYVELTKPKIVFLELLAVAAAALMAGLDPRLLMHALLGTALVAASASALNQWWEREVDSVMERTADRPLPAGRLREGDVLACGLISVIGGTLYLAAAVNLLTAGLGLLTWVLYVLVYTPLKARTPVNTCVGAIAGAMPVLMGYAAMGRPLDLQAATLFLIVFLWQFPHFMAIAWIYRRQYRSAGMQMLTVVDPSGFRAGAQAVLAALALVPVSLVPAVLPAAGHVYLYFGCAWLLGVGQLLCAVAFFKNLDDASARRLLRATLVYLPALLLLFMLSTGI